MARRNENGGKKETKDEREKPAQAAAEVEEARAGAKAAERPRIQIEQDGASPFTVERLELALGASIEEVQRLRREVQAAISRAFDAEARARELEHARYAQREEADESRSRVRALAERLAEAEAREKAQAARLEQLKREAVRQAERAAREAEEATRQAAEQALKKTEMRARAEIRKLKGEIKQLEARLASERTRAQARESAVRAELEEIVSRAVVAAEKAVREVVRKAAARMETQALAEFERLEEARRTDGVEERMRRAVLDAEASAREALEALERTEERLRAELAAARREAAALRERLEVVRREAVRETEARLREMLEVAERERKEALRELEAMRDENRRLLACVRALDPAVAGGDGTGPPRRDPQESGLVRAPVPRPRKAEGGVAKTRMLSTAGKRYLDWDQPIGVLLPAIEELLGQEGEQRSEQGASAAPKTAPLVPVPQELGAANSAEAGAQEALEDDGEEFEPEEWSGIGG